MRHPFYLLFAGTACVLLYLANDRGWSLITKALTGGGVRGRSGLYHK